MSATWRQCGRFICILPLLNRRQVRVLNVKRNHVAFTLKKQRDGGTNQGKANRHPTGNKEWANTLRKILAEHFTWPQACKQLLTDLVRVE